MPPTSSASSSHISRSIHSSGFDRRVHDFYATPNWVTEALLRHVQFRGRVWEPCCGTGAITSVLQRHAAEFPDIKLFPITAVAKDWTDAYARYFADGGVFDGIYGKK